MKMLIVASFIFFISINISFGQTENKEFAEAEKLFADELFAGALPRYLDLLKSDPSNVNLNFKAGVCYLNSRSQKIKAVDYLPLWGIIAIFAVGIFIFRKFF